MKRSGPNGKSRGWIRPRRRPSWLSCGGSRCRYAARSPRWRKSAGSSPGRRAGGSNAWLEDLLHDRRCADYLAERFARAFVGTEEGPFLRFRRRRFVAWLSDAILQDRRYDAIVRDLIADDGLWTDHPATNFLTVTIDEKTERPTPDRLSARVSRAFLGVRLDCAQCHDHPFQPWKQSQFRGLAAFFGAVHSDLRGIRDTENDYRPLDRKGNEVPVVDPCVPFLPELLPGREAGGPRDRLAGWMTDPRNPNLARITVNRVWALLFGRPLAEPVDDLPAAGELHPALLLLADDFSAHGYDLRRLIRAIATTEVFRLDSAADNASEEHEAAWAVFPMTRLRPEQVAGACSSRPRSPPSARNRTGSRGWSPTPAATISSSGTATPARTSSTPAPARSPSAFC